MNHSFKVIVIGSKGFLGQSIVQDLRAYGIKSTALSRSEIDLNIPSSVLKLRELITPESILVFAAAKAPARTEDVLLENIQMVSNLLKVISDLEFSYLLNVSSDAVYPDLSGKIDEGVQIAPTSIHGSMHAEREKMLNALKVPVGHLRPTLVYGASDPHGGYGPNQFVKSAMSGLPIKLFGEGEELRDHIDIRDVGKIARAMITNKQTGPINAVSGEVHSFREIAEVISHKVQNTKIVFLKRSGPVPHNGYRAFKLAKVQDLVPSFKAITIQRGLENMINELRAKNG